MGMAQMAGVVMHMRVLPEVSGIRGLICANLRKPICMAPSTEDFQASADAPMACGIAAWPLVVPPLQAPVSSSPEFRRARKALWFAPMSQ